jgi:hypothetical protein
MGTILHPGEKVHVIHRRLFEKDLRKHFIGVVDAYADGVIRATGHIFVIEDPKENLFRRKREQRVRLMSLHGGNLLINVIPQHVDLEKVAYEYQQNGLRVTDGSDWFMDIKEFGWA